MKIETDIHIDAPPETVWAVTENVDAWPDWTPTVTKARSIGESRFGVGSRYALKQPMQAEAIWEVTHCTLGTGFTWTKQGSDGRMQASHRLVPSAGGTTNILSIEVRGLLFSVLWPVFRPVLMHALKTENAGLKAFCEARERRATG